MFGGESDRRRNAGAAAVVAGGVATRRSEQDWPSLARFVIVRKSSARTTSSRARSLCFVFVWFASYRAGLPAAVVYVENRSGANGTRMDVLRRKRAGRGLHVLVCGERCSNPSVTKLNVDLAKADPIVQCPPAGRSAAHPSLGRKSIASWWRLPRKPGLS